MTIQITLRIDRRFVFIMCVLLAGVAVLFAPRGATSTQAAACATPIPDSDLVKVPREAPAAIQRYDHGYMIWIGDVDLLYVLYDGQPDGHAGTFETYPDHWKEGMPETDPKFVPPPMRFQPTRGGGLLWRTNDHVRNGLGWGVFPPMGFETLVTQKGDEYWLNGRDTVFHLTGSKWEEVYYWWKK
jgi:hypothetical protein